MAHLRFIIDRYVVLIAREHNSTVNGLDIRVRAAIFCRGELAEGDACEVTVYVLDDSSPVPDNWVKPDATHGNIFVPRWQFECILDLLRTEKPVGCELNSDEPRQVLFNAEFRVPRQVEQSELAEGTGR
jgi:hypothetical protein